MWPKMLLEFLPHLSRLIPAADNYLNSRKESEKIHAGALTSLTDEVRNGFANVAEEQGALRRDMQTHVASSAQAGVDAARARVGVEALESRLSQLEERLVSISRILWVALAILAALVIAVAIRAWR